MIFEEINFLASHKFKSLTDVKEFKEKLDNKLPELKGKREKLWRIYKKVISTENKENIKCDIDKITNEIDTIYGQRNACKRVFETYNKTYKEYYREKELKGKIIDTTKNKKIKDK